MSNKYHTDAYDKAALAADLKDQFPGDFMAHNLRLPRMYRKWDLIGAFGTNAVTGSGAVTNFTPSTLCAVTGATNNSSAICTWFDECPPGGYTEMTPWALRRFIGFGLALFGSHSSVVRTVQFKRGNAIGELGARGIEIYCDNLDVYGGSYSTGLSKTTKLFTAEQYKWQGILIDHNPAAGRIDFYVNTGAGFPAFGSPTASITTAANIPSITMDDAACYVCVSVSKGVVADDCVIGIIDLWELYPD